MRISAHTDRKNTKHGLIHLVRRRNTTLPRNTPNAPRIPVNVGGAGKGKRNQEKSAPTANPAPTARRFCIVIKLWRRSMKVKSVSLVRPLKRSLVSVPDRPAKAPCASS